ncbi:MAG: hypothetical protein JWO19_3697 [Bryobacterales bacterium]|nr:hypothetical protein [Bryobacterales bacterium]
MISECETVEALHRAFWITLLLSGNIEAAEAAVLDGIAELEVDHTSRDSLLLAITKSAIQRRTEFFEQSEGLSILPRELRRLLLLARNCRDCFVLRILIGLTPRHCSGILHLSIHEVEDALYTALHELPRLEACDTNRSEIARHCVRKCASRMNKEADYISEGASETWENI